MTAVASTLSPRAAFGWATAIVGRHDAGLPVNPQALREARAILKHAREVA